jgi:succinate dehydrogenase / fumarate reductase cytochrome b subunit
MNRRPYYLDLIRIRLPVGGLVSILHRASGALLALAVPALLYLFMSSLRSADEFQRLGHLFSGGPGRLAGVLATWALLHHFLAGLRHLGFDFGWGEARARARLSAQVTLWLALALTAVLWLGASL